MKEQVGKEEALSGSGPGEGQDKDKDGQLIERGQMVEFIKARMAQRS